MEPLRELAESPFKLSLEQYHRMIEAGILDEDDKVELLHGVLVAREPNGVDHAGMCQRLTRLLSRGIGDAFDLRVDLPLTVPGEESEPEPDFAVVPAGPLPTHHPFTALLVVEVAKTSLRRDRFIKAGIYAAAGVKEYWIVDVNTGVVEVFRNPNRRARRYASVRKRQGRDQLTPLKPLEGPSFKVADLFR